MRADVVKGGPKFAKFFKGLDIESKRYKEITGSFDLLKEDVSRGNRIPKDRWPKCYIKAYDTNNLYRYSLTDGWRMIYCIYSRGGNIVCNILESFDHKGYDRRFDY